jgi:hypothetical protein
VRERREKPERERGHSGYALQKNHPTWKRADLINSIDCSGLEILGGRTGKSKNLKDKLEDDNFCFQIQSIF